MANGASEEDQVGGDLDLGLQLLAAQQHAPGQALTWPQRRVLRLAASGMASAARPPVGGGKWREATSFRPSLSEADGDGECGGVRLRACCGVRLRRDEMAPAVRGPVGLAKAASPPARTSAATPPSAGQLLRLGRGGSNARGPNQDARTDLLSSAFVCRARLSCRCCCRMGRTSLVLQALVALVCLTVVSGQFFVNLNDKNKVLAMCVCTQTHRWALH